nr:hypothetical protein [Tanacetum cinerariifolium]
DSDESGVTYTDISSPFEELSDIRSPRANDHEHLMLPEMLEDPYVEVALQAPPSPDYIPGPEEPEQAPPSPDYSPEYVPESDFEAHPEDDDDEDPEEDPVDYPGDGGDDGDDEEESSEDDEDDDMDVEADEEEEKEEEHPAPADSVVVASTAADHAPSMKETEPFKIDESAATPPPHPAYHMTARISILAPVPMPAWTDSEVVRLLVISSPPALPLSPWSSPPPQIPFPPLPPILSPPLPILSPAPPPSPIRSLGYRAAMIRLRDEAASTSSLPLQLEKRLGITLGPRYDVGESSSAAARAAGGLMVDYGFVATMDREIMRDLEREVGYGITDSWDEIVETLQGAPVSTDTELGGYVREFETRVRQDTDKIYMRRQTVISELLRIDHRRSTKITELRTALQGQVTALQGQVKGYQEKDKIGSKPSKNRNRGEAWRRFKQLQWIKEEKPKKTQKEWSKMHARTYTSGANGNNSGKQRTVVCYNCKREGHMSKQCTKPKRKRDESWFKNKVLLVQAQANRQILHKEELAFLVDPGIAEAQITHNVALMVNLSYYGSDDLAEKEEPRNIDREPALEKQIKELNNIVFKRNKSAQTVHMLTKPQFFYDHTTKQALGFQNLFYLKKAQQLKPKLYDGSVIQKTNAIVIRDFEETLMLAEESRSKMIQKQKDLMMSEKKVNTKPVDYATLNQLLQDFETRFVPQTDLSAEQVFKVRFTEPVTSSGNKPIKTSSSSNVVSNKPILSSKGVTLPTSASGSRPSGNTKKDKIQQTPSSAKKNKLEAYLRNVRTSLQNKKSVVNPKNIASVQESKLNVNSDLQCVTCNGCLFFDNHDSYVLEFINSVNDHVKSKSAKKPLKRNVVQIILWYLDSGCSKHMTGDRSQLTNFVNKFLGTVKFGNDHVAKIIGYGDYKIGNVTISRVYFVEGLGHNLFSIGQFCDSNLEVAFRQHTCFIHNLEASKTKSWLWHRRLSHLNFSAINHLARQGLVRGRPKLKFEKDHLYFACAMGKSKKKSHKPKSEETN